MYSFSLDESIDGDERIESEVEGVKDDVGDEECVFAEGDEIDPVATCEAIKLAVDGVTL